MGANRVSSISQADTLGKMGEFWDTHDFTDFDNLETPDVEFQIACAVPIELDLLSAVEHQARLRGVQVETLINLWLQQKLAEQSSRQSSAPAPVPAKGSQPTRRRHAPRARGETPIWCCWTSGCRIPMASRCCVNGRVARPRWIVQS